jgi:membrane-associated phospholipid phosphatase
MKATLFIAVALVGATTGTARAQETPSSNDVSYPVDGAIIGLSLAGAYLFSLIPVDTDRSWESELFGGLDRRLRGRYSRRAAKISDAALALTIATPLLEQLGRDVDGRAGERAMIYGETFGLNLLATSAVKYSVGRPRPYSYGEGDHRDEDSYLSFYSGHASIAFSSAVAGSTLFANDSGSTGKSAAVWMINLTLASATANMRIRAGKHFYSDVLVGALVGSAIGFGVPALHAGEAGLYTPSALEVGAMAGGLVLGTAVSQLIPLGGDSEAPTLGLAPAMIEGGTGLALSGSLR